MQNPDHPKSIEIDLLASSNEQFIVEPRCGAHISRVCEDVVALSRASGRSVKFKFNDLELTTRKGEDAQMLAQRFQHEIRLRAEAWAQTEEAKEIARKSLEELELTQALVDGLLLALPEAVKTQRRLLAWVGEFASVNDRIGLVYDRKALISLFTSQGYTRNDLVGEDSETIKSDLARATRYIVGQAIDHLSRDMPLHPRLASMAQLALAKHCKEDAS